MTLLANRVYDPATAASISTAALQPMTAIDTLNLRATFVAPANGSVLVRMQCTTQFGSVSTWVPQILLGILQAGVVIARVNAKQIQAGTALATTLCNNEALFVVSGLTPGTTYTWDAAYGVEALVTASAIKYGGPNDAVANNSFGAFVFEIWDCPLLLGSKSYDPATLQAKATSAALAMTALDTVNLRITFTAPASGSVLVRMLGSESGATTFPQILMGVMSGATVVARVHPKSVMGGINVASTLVTLEALFAVTGLTPGTSYTWDAAYAVETGVAGTALKYGGPNDSTASNALGAFLFEVWDTA